MKTGICQNPFVHYTRRTLWPGKHLPVRICNLRDFAPGYRYEVFGVINDGTILGKEGIWMAEKSKNKKRTVNEEQLT